MTTNSCSISGVPRMHQTNVLLTALSGLNLDIEQNAISNPSGRENSKVPANSLQFSKNPTASSKLTC